MNVSGVFLNSNPESNQKSREMWTREARGTCRRGARRSLNLSKDIDFEIWLWGIMRIRESGQGYSASSFARLRSMPTDGHAQTASKGPSGNLHPEVTSGFMICITVSTMNVASYLTKDTLTTMPQRLPGPLMQKYRLIDTHSLGSGRLARIVPHDAHESCILNGGFLCCASRCRCPRVPNARHRDGPRTRNEGALGASNEDVTMLSHLGPKP